MTPTTPTSPTASTATAALRWTLIPLPQPDAAAAFAPHAAAWDALQARVAGLPFLESAFLAPLLSVFGTGRERLALLGDPKAPRAAAIVTPAGTAQWTTFQPSQLPLGAWLSAGGEALEPLADGLLRALPLPALALGLTQIDSLFHPRPADGTRWRGQDYIDTAWVDLTGDFTTYWEARGKNLRQNLKKQQKKLDTAGTVTRLECLTRPEDVAPALDHYGRLEASGWKGSEGTAIAPGHPQYEFYRAMLEAFCARRPGPALPVLVRRRRRRDGPVHRVGRQDRDPQDRLRRGAQGRVAVDADAPAAVPISCSTRPAAGGPIRRIEFYGKVMEWHTRWTADARPVYHATLYRWAGCRRSSACCRGGAEPGADAAQESAAKTPEAASAGMPEAASAAMPEAASAAMPETASAATPATAMASTSPTPPPARAESAS